MLDAWRLAVGTLTAIPVKPPTTVDRRTARWAMLLAPVAVVPLGLLAAATMWVAQQVDVPGLAAGLLVVGVLALGSRAFHLDGLSDVADGLTASHDRERSLAVMKTGTSGPAGTAALIVVLGTQAAAIGGFGFVTKMHAPLLVGAVVCLSRGALSLTCVRGVPAARRDGIGSPFAGSVPRTAAAATWVAVLVVLQVLCAWSSPLAVGVRGVATGVVTLVAVGLLIHRTVHRFGGVTGDVYGAAIEISLAVMLLGVFSGPVLMAG